MGRRQTPISTALASSLTVRDEDFQLWQYRIVDGIGTYRTYGRKPARRRGRQTSRTAVKKPGTSPPVATDDVYYLRWNLTGDYDSDDEDWWNEVMALEREAHNNDRKKEKLAAEAAAKERIAKEEALYWQYKDHTRYVMEWGNSTWVDRYDGPNSESDVGIAHLSLRTLVGRLNELARVGIGMPSSIYRDLEQAIELREEFQNRIVSERLRQKEGREIQKSRRKNINIVNPTDSLSELGAGDCFDDNKTEEDAPKNTKQDVTKENKESGIYKHKWILYQLKALSNRFRIEPDSSISPPDDSNDAEDCGIVLWESKNSCGGSSRETHTEHSVTDKCPFDNNDKERIGDKSCVEAPYRRIVREDDVATANLSSCCMWSSSTSVCNDNRYTGQCSTSDLSDDDWDEIFGDDGSLIENHENHDPCLQTPEIVVSITPRHLQDESQSLSIQEISNRSCNSGDNETDDLDEIFGDDGSLIENFENHEPCLQTPEIVLPLTPCHLQAESQSLSTQEISNPSCNSGNNETDDWDDIFGDDGSIIENHNPCFKTPEIILPLTPCHLQDESKHLSTQEIFNPDCNSLKNKTDSCPKPKMAQIAISPDNNTLSGKISELSITSNNSIRRHLSSRNNNETPIDESKSKCVLSNSKNISDELGQQKPQSGTILSSKKSVVTPEKPSASKDCIIPTTNRSSLEQLRQTKHYSSVWKISFEEEKWLLSKPKNIPVELDHKKLQPAVISSQKNVIATPEKPSASKDFTIPPTDGSKPERARQTIQHGSVWDISFQEEKWVLSKSKNIPDELEQQKLQPGMTPKIPSASNDFTTPATNRSNPERARQPKQYGSVWDISFQEENETSMHSNTCGTPVLTDEISLQNSNPPDDWETLLEEEEEEDILKAEMLVEEARGHVTCKAEETKKASDDALPSELGGRNMEFSQREKNTIETDDPTKVVGQEMPARDSAKLNKPPYATTKNLGYDSVWDIFIKENTSNSLQVVDNDVIPRSTTSMVQNPEPEDDWEALYA